MLDIFTDNWDTPPFIDEDLERVIRIDTGNDMDVLYAIVPKDLDDEGVEDEVRMALRAKHGRGYGYRGWYDVSDEFHWELFEEYVLDAYLGEFAGDFDRDAIIEETTFVNYRDGNRYCLNMDPSEFDEIVRRHERKEC